MLCTPPVENIDSVSDNQATGHKAVTDKARSGNLCYITDEVQEASSKKIVPPPIPFFGAHYYYETCAIDFFVLMSSVVCRPLLKTVRALAFGFTQSEVRLG